MLRERARRLDRACSGCRAPNDHHAFKGDDRAAAAARVEAHRQQRRVASFYRAQIERGSARPEKTFVLPEDDLRLLVEAAERNA